MVDQNIDKLNQKDAMAVINKYIWTVMPVTLGGKIKYLI